VEVISLSGNREAMRILWIAVGGAFGTLLRYGCNLAMVHLLGRGFPYSTLLVNLVGSYFMGLVMYLSVYSNQISDTMRLTLTTGIMGGLTTYSTFNYETLEYIRARMWVMAAANILLTGLGCLLSGLAGLMSGQWLAGR
jgi:CrcB protein